MEPKKSPKADLQNKKALFLEIGLVVALGVTILAFGIGNTEKKIEILDLGAVSDEVEMVDVTVEKPKEITSAPQTVTVIANLLNVVRNDSQISTNISFAEFDQFEEINLVPLEVKDEEIEEDTPILIAEVMPSFQGGGLMEFRKWVTDRFRYPAPALENNIQGTVIIEFVIERDGKLTNIVVTQTPDKILSDEAVRVMAMSPKWKPGKQRDMPVRVKYTMPINFVIQN